MENSFNASQLDGETDPPMAESQQHATTSEHIPSASQNLSSEQSATLPFTAPQQAATAVMGNNHSTVAGSGQELSSSSGESVPVVKVWSIRGVEYAIMSFMLWAIAVGLNWIIVALINGSAGFVELSAPVSLLVVSLPFFAFFFLRLKKAELANQVLKTESSKRRFSQISQVVSFLVVFFSLLTIVGSILGSIGGEKVELGKVLASAVVFILVWGGVFSYYWLDEHRNVR